MRSRGWFCVSVVLVAAAALVGSAALVLPAEAQTVVLTTDFEDGTTQGWTGRGSITLTNTTAAAYSGTHSLLASNRTGDWQGPNLDLLSTVRRGVKYQYVLYARMAPDAGNANLHTTLQLRPTGAQDSEFQWLSPDLPVTESAWVRLAGSYTLMKDVDQFAVFVESDASLGSFYIDDFTLTQLPPSVPGISSPTEGTVTSDTTPTISGRGDVGNTITVTEGGTTICTATVTGEAINPNNGTWSCTPTVALSEGTHYLMPSAQDSAGVTTAGVPVTVVVDTTPPAAPVITVPVNQAELATSPPAIFGTGEAFTTVTVTEGDTTVCTATVQGNGTWSCSPTAALAAGSHTLTPTAEDRAGNTTAGAPITFTIDSTPPGAPAITSPADGTLINDATPTVSGTGDAGDTVTVAANGTTVCTATVAANGTWTCTPTAPLADGVNRLTPNARDAVGNTTVGASVVITVDATPPVVPAITSPTQGEVISDTTPTITGTGETGTTITIRDENNNVICTVPIEVCGHWTCTPTNPLTAGTHTLTPTAQDPAGNTSTGNPITITVNPAGGTARAAGGGLPRCPFLK